MRRLETAVISDGPDVVVLHCAMDWCEGFIDLPVFDSEETLLASQKHVKKMRRRNSLLSDLWLVDVVTWSWVVLRNSTRKLVDQAHNIVCCVRTCLSGFYTYTNCIIGRFELNVEGSKGARSDPLSSYGERNELNKKRSQSVYMTP